MSLSSPEQSNEFLRAEIWRKSDIVLTRGEENSRFEALVSQVLSRVDVARMDRRTLYVKAYDFMSQNEIEGRDTTLFLLLLEKSLDKLDLVEDQRRDLLTRVEAEYEQEKAIDDPEDYDAEYVGILARDLAILSRGSFEEIVRVLEDRNDEDASKPQKRKSIFAGHYIRTVLSHEQGNRRYTETFKQQLADLLETSTSSVASMKAWGNGEFVDKSKTLEAVIDKMRARIERKMKRSRSNGESNAPKQESDTEVSNKVVESSDDSMEQSTEAPVPSPESLNFAYGFILESENCEFARSIEPSSFVFDEEGGPSVEQRRWIYALFIYGPEAKPDRTRLRKYLCDNILGCNRGTLGSITAYLTGALYEKAKLAETEIGEAIRFVEGAGEKAGELIAGGGEHFEYDNEAKIEWRRKLQAFINKNTDPSERANMRVLCMPGKKCLEIPVYTELGFRPENIVGVEGGDSAAREEFARRANELGIEGRLGRLEKGVVQDDLPFDLVSLDFLGAMCPTYLKVLATTPLSNRSIVCINAMAKREDLRAEYNLLVSSQGFSGDISNFERGLKGLDTFFMQNASAYVRSLIFDDKAVKDTRDEAMPAIMMLALSEEVDPLFASYMERIVARVPDGLPIPPYVFLNPILFGIMEPMGNVANKLFQMSDPDLSRKLCRLMIKAWTPLPRLLNYEGYKYRSSSSSPFQSCFMRVESCEELLRQHHDLLNSLFSLLAIGIELQPKKTFELNIADLPHLGERYESMIERGLEEEEKMKGELDKIFSRKIIKRGAVRQSEKGWLRFIGHRKKSQQALSFNQKAGRGLITRHSLVSAVRAIGVFDSGDTYLNMQNQKE